MSALLGTIYYIAPEVIRGHGCRWSWESLPKLHFRVAYCHLCVAQHKEGRCSWFCWSQETNYVHPRRSNASLPES